MQSKKLVFKVLAILGLTLGCGLATMVVISIVLQSRSTMNLQLKNTHNLAAIFIKGIDEYMMKGDSSQVNSYAEELKKNKFIMDLKIYDEQGKQSESKDTTVNSSIVTALKTGRSVEFTSEENGVRALNIAIPFVNEDRCKKCHDASSKFLGGMIVKTSIQDGYDSSRTTSITLVVICVAFFFILLGCLFLFLRAVIIKPIIECSQKVEELASGEGDLTRVVPVTSDDEIGALATGINRLISKIHDIMTQIAKNAEELDASADNLLINSETMSAEIRDSVVQIDMLATASEEMAATSSDIAHNCVAAAEESKRANISANTGVQEVERTISVMARIADKVNKSAASVELLGSRSDQIGEIVSTIEDIADQTNLLALNAAIEAARAGEQGRGFAVVADEVRALAVRTTNATREIGVMIKAIQTETGSAVDIMKEGVQEVESGTVEAGKSGKALQDIMSEVSAVVSQVNQIATAAEEQTATTSEISKNIQLVTVAVQDTSKGAQLSNDSAKHMATLSHDLKRLVGQFKL
ncbi:MAG: methyl-accepting chemotaxis protein [Desulfuromonadales bacterium]|nr:methyl-accepting chemotaxis protein [Desulfuromonadales bacterium]